MYVNARFNVRLFFLIQGILQIHTKLHGYYFEQLLLFKQPLSSNKSQLMSI